MSLHSIPIGVRFLRHISKQANGCILWVGTTQKSGYGVMSIGKPAKLIGAHRVSYELFVGSIPAGLFVLHRCDVKNCVNPTHLFVGTHTDNIRDAAKKKRLPFGAGHHMSKFNEEDIRTIRARHIIGVSGYRLAQEYDVALVTIYKILHRESWKHVE